jgi:hypothetical protein
VNGSIHQTVMNNAYATSDS